MKRDNEKEIRTELKKMLICTAIKNETGDYELIKRDGPKEDRISVDSFLTQVFGESYEEH